MPKGEHLRGKGGVKFGSGQATNLGGRPKSYFNEVWSIIVKDTEVTEIQLSKNDKFKLIERLMETSLLDLKAVKNNPNLPVFIVNIASAIISDIEGGRTQTIDRYFDRFFGRAEQTVSIGVSTDNRPEWLKGVPTIDEISNES